MNQYYKEPKRKNKTLKVVGITLVVLVAFGSTLFLGNFLATKGVIFAGNREAYKKVFKDVEDIDSFKTLFEVREELLQLYDGEIDNETLVEGAIKGMTSALGDPYTVYMNKDEYENFMQSNSGSFVGIGVYIGVNDNDQVEVSSVIKDAPADKAGMLAGDIIVSIEGTEVGSDSSKAVTLIKGEKDTEVNLVVLRNGTEEINITAVRDEIKTTAVTGEMIDDKVGYIQLNTFADLDASVEFENKLKELEDQGMKGLILDLRGNGGGYLKEAISIASQFIPKGEVVTYTIDKYDKKQEYKSEGGLAIGMPLVVLTDYGSASASEVLTGALKDYGAATTVGETTYGKGVVQIPFELKSGEGGLKVTVSRYYSPNGINIDKTGITPDIEVEYPEELLKEKYNRDTDPQFAKALEVVKEKIK